MVVRLSRLWSAAVLCTLALLAALPTASASKHSSTRRSSREASASSGDAPAKGLGRTIFVLKTHQLTSQAVAHYRILVQNLGPQDVYVLYTGESPAEGALSMPAVRTLGSAGPTSILPALGHGMVGGSRAERWAY